MKKKLNRMKYLKFLVVTITTLLLVFSCQVEQESIQESQNSNIKVTEKPFKDLLKEITFSRAYAKIAHINNTQNGNTMSRSAIEDEYGFTIADAPAKVTVVDDVISYTMLINRDSETTANVFENLIIQIEGNETEMAIAKYTNITPLENSVHNSFEMNVEVEIKALDNTNANRILPIKGMRIVTCNNDGYCGNGDLHFAGSGCVDPSHLNTYDIGGGGFNSNPYGTVQSGVFGTGPGGNTTTTSNNASGNNSQTSGSGAGGSIITAPVALVMTPKKNFEMNSLNAAQRAWLGAQPTETQNTIYSYLESTGTPDNPEVAYSQVKVDYIKNVIDEIRNTPNNPLPSNVTIVRPMSTVSEITDINDYLKCFDKTQPASFTLYVDQPTANSNTPWSGNPLSPDVGHTFISIKQGTTRRLLGFYPGIEVDLDNPATTGVFHDNSAHEFDVSISLVINPAQLTNLLNYVKTKSTATYNLNSYNCTDFGMAAASLAGLSLPSAFGTWGAPGVGTGAGDNPGQLGQNVRGLPTPTGAVKSTSSGTSLSNTGTCL
jgi:hypothetical protein